MDKNVIKLTICNNDCLLSTDDPESYVRAMGDEVEKAVNEFLEQNPRISVTLAALLAALRLCDEKKHALDDADNLRGQIRDYLEESSRARLEAEEARREIERMKREIQTLRARLSGSGETPAEAAPSSADGAAGGTYPAKQAVRSPQQPSAPSMQVGSYTRPQKEPPEPEGSHFMEFFEKKD